MNPDATSMGSTDAGRRRLARLMAARLAVALAVLVLALAFVGAGEEAEEAARGLYGTIAAAFLSTAAFAAGMRWVRNVPRYAAFQLVVDLSLVTAVVLFSGGGRSIFAFLYLPIVVLASVLFQRWGGYGSAVAASLGFALVLASAPPSPFGGQTADPFEVSMAIWGVHTGALLLVALLSSTLARELSAADRDLRASRSELERLEALHERTFEHLTSGLIATDARGRVRTCNPEGERILGRSAEELEGRPIRELLAGVDTLLAEGADGSGRARSRLERAREDGSIQHVGIAVSVLRTVGGDPDGHVVIFQDVTQVVELEAELQRRARLAGIGELAASIAHEIRNPLAAISGSVEMLEAEVAPVDRRRLMAIVLREIDRLDQLIADFLAYARPSPPSIKTVRVDRMLHEIHGVWDQAQARLEIEVPDGLAVEADPDQLRQVLWNLLRNAQQAGGAEATVRVRAGTAPPQAGSDADRSATDEEGSFVEFSVSDSGAGIAPAILDRIFDPFFTTKPEGTGLGLPMVHRILQAHGSAVQVDSRPGGGTTFRFRFPVSTGARS